MNYYKRAKELIKKCKRATKQPVNDYKNIPEGKNIAYHTTTRTTAR